jgi:hypothetical protein
MIKKCEAEVQGEAEGKSKPPPQVRIAYDGKPGPVKRRSILIGVLRAYIEIYYVQYIYTYS